MTGGVLLVSMPWAALSAPSMALSTLAPLVDGHDVTVRYANLDWAERVGLSAAEYNTIADSYFAGLGDWVFAGALHGTVERFLPAPAADGVDPEALFATATEFIDELAAEIVSADPVFLGLTSTFMQNTASLALARAVKRAAPHIVVALGGANCDGEQGAALARAFDFLDLVVRGEGERALPAILRALGQPEALSQVDGLCWRAANGTLVENPPGPVLPISELPEADQSAYFDRLARSPLAGEIRPTLVLEGSRGCWWGAKHHCTFCGLNGSTMAYRAKSPHRVVAELTRAVGRHKVLDVTFVDNILDVAQLRAALPEIAELGWDLRMFFEVKANLRYAELHGLLRAGVHEIQPGIENLSSRVLGLMRKGVTGAQNVALLRDCRTLGLTVRWNYLFGFPGESDDDYVPIVERLTDLHHLEPPISAARVQLERFSPYFTDPELGLVNLGPSRIFRQIYPTVPADELARMVYHFASVPAGISGEPVTALGAAVSAWRAGHDTASLRKYAAGDRTLIVDTRAGRNEEYVLSIAESRCYEALGRPRSRAAVPADDAVWHRLAELGLVFTEGGRHVALATGVYDHRQAGGTPGGRPKVEALGGQP
ncbi:RiPP maturation radical SAM protein 1 [Longispora fulva]|uniref:Ribosomal peptide maturation radical SAM protein 1 n=1 Tax=Longispora fulva TaxID=619741 RepID=A0A8J7KI21_9ACTN|nr:RiPP maturation radical SAM C-methyltransferase [Longispora fulva]MBG6135784.1 ribosomal peptide maturation radical SAM protein 1 [Longispora fulva]GIG55975.1 RiPP maturation radical SAM protein 1 [Longispora fulva]